MDRSNVMKELALATISRKTLQMHFDLMKFTGKQREDFCAAKDLQDYTRSLTPDTAPKALTGFTHSDVGPWLRSMMYSLDHLRHFRKKSRLNDEDTFMAKIKKTAKIWAETGVRYAFPNLDVAIKMEKVVTHYVTVGKHTDIYGNVSRKTIITLPIHWGKSVHARGIDLVKAGDGLVFILYAKKSDVKRMQDEGVECFECAGLKYKNGRPSVEKYWVLKWKGHDTTVLSINKEFYLSERMLRSRIKRAVVDALTM